MYKQLCTQSCSTHLRQYMYTRKNSTCTRDAVRVLYNVHNTPPPSSPICRMINKPVQGGGRGDSAAFSGGKKRQHRSEPRRNIFIPNIPPQGRFERIASNRSSTCSRLASPRLICICITPCYPDHQSLNRSGQCEFSHQVQSSQCEFSDQAQSSQCEFSDQA